MHTVWWNDTSPPVVAEDLVGHFVVDVRDAITVSVAAAAADWSGRGALIGWLISSQANEHNIR